ncbi:MAG: hypothetical protein LBI05_09900 [Planctomycetaceae bacterium]|jgi:hypothetical protein|nr:hypothetical protein [Planctomycetaceae bacterium]
MALLDSIFSGEQSVTALLANMLAGSATVVCPGTQGAYDPVTDTYATTGGDTYDVKFIQETLKQNVLTHVDGVQIESGDLVGIVPAYQIKSPLRRRVDRLQRNKVSYLIVSTEEISSGDDIALIRILCKR